MKNINILDKGLCTGCGACQNVCPTNAIDMVADADGFLFPVIKENCTDCGVCGSICSAITGNLNLQEKPRCFAVWAKQRQRESGSSGGVFACLAEQIIDKGGIVFGAAFEKGCRTLKHIGVTSKEELVKIYKSKYVQSEIGDAFTEVKKHLENGVAVLFSGCPCQVDGLKAYLRKDYENLYTVDILCHGVPSPLAYNRFLDEVAQGREIVSADFRDKKYGWGTLINVTFSDNTVHYDHYNGNYFKAFLSGMSMRESCLHCKYAQPTRVGDITLGDFWGVGNYKEDWNDNKGTSLVLCNSEKGINLLEEVSCVIERKEEVEYNTVVEISAKANAAMVRPTHEPEMRKNFFMHIRKGDNFSKALRYAERALIDIGLMGWWIETPWSNYGSTLTNYALYRYLSDEGYSVAFISPAGFDRKDAGKFNFENGYRMTAKYTMEQMSENNKYIDTFIVGSDVLWYYNAFIRSGYNFMLDFVDDKKKKISYATSFGNTRSFFPDNEIPKITRLLRKFDSVAVREYEAVDICRERFGVESTHVLDPVFLTDMKHWDVLASRAERKTEGKYLFVYMLDPTPEKAEEVKKLAAKKNLALVSITDKQFNPEEKTEILRRCGILEKASIDEFIYHIKNAEFVVTDSYHGSCFSLIFRRDFLVLVNRARGGARFDTLADLFGIDYRFAESVTEISSKESLHVSMDYSKVGPHIEREIERCKEWLLHAIESEKVIKPVSNEEILIDQCDELKKKVSVLEKTVERLNGVIEKLLHGK
ncbi:MAG: polysaccharide pyruvyl transferase family protein [Lachnospiraceae bacterium]|nr:polysaccharide pyruvyl transferase family protein [Lachnospiraceae bacterium]